MAEDVSDRELFDRLPLNDTWCDAKLFEVFNYLWQSKSTCIPESWFCTMYEFHEEFRGAVVGDPDLVAEYSLPGQDIHEYIAALYFGHFRAPIRSKIRSTFGHFRTPIRSTFRSTFGLFRTILGHFGENQKRKRAQKIRKPGAKIRKRAQFFFLVVSDSEFFRSCSELFRIFFFWLFRSCMFTIACPMSCTNRTVKAQPLAK